MAKNKAKKGFDNGGDGTDFGKRVEDNVRKQFQPLVGRPTAKYASGARCILKINDEICGFAFGITWRIVTQSIEINAIDDPFPHELAPQRITVDGTISALHIPGEGVGVKLWQPDVLNFLFQRYITIEVRDTVTDALLFYTDKAMITSRQEDIKVDSLASVQLSWRAIGYNDERKPAPPTGLDDSQQSEGGGFFKGAANVLRKVTSII